MATPVRSEDGRNAYVVTIDGKDLSDYFFDKSPPYQNFKIGEEDEKTVRVALMEVWHFRGLPDNLIVDVGVEVRGYVIPPEKETRVAFTASRVGCGPFHYGGGDDGLETSVDVDEEAFENEDDFEDFVAAIETYLVENYSFELKCE